MYNLVLGENNAADQTKAMQDQMSGAALSMPDDLNKAFKVIFVYLLLFFFINCIRWSIFWTVFKAECDSLTVTDHNWVMKGIEQRLLNSAE